MQPAELKHLWVGGQARQHLWLGKQAAGGACSAARCRGCGRLCILKPMLQLRIGWVQLQACRPREGRKLQHGQVQASCMPARSPALPIAGLHAHRPPRRQHFAVLLAVACSARTLGVSLHRIVPLPQSVIGGTQARVALHR